MARLGRAANRNQQRIAVVQWCIVVLYAALLFAPFLLPLPEAHARILTHAEHFAQFLFWGLGWPSIMLSMMLFGRVWCGIFCPDGTLTEYVSRHGRKQSIPRWIRWSGWPCTVLVLTTLYGQLVGVYETHPGTLLLLGLPTLGALWCGYMYANGKRIWCMYLCPANGVFSLLAKISPVHFRVDASKWKGHPPPLPRVDCPPLIDIRKMKSASACHACARCSGYLDAVDLALRPPDSEIRALSNQEVRTSEAVTLVFGVLGICTAAMHWREDTWFAALKQFFAHHGLASLEPYTAPRWLLSSTVLDGLSITLYLLGAGLLLGGIIWLAIWLAARLTGDPALSWQRLSLALIPLAGADIVAGLSINTVQYLGRDGWSLHWAGAAQTALLLVGGTFALWLGWSSISSRIGWRRYAALIPFMLPVLLIGYIWTNRLM